MHVTVIPADNAIIVDGVGLSFAFTAPENLHALQWHEDTGHMEFADCPNQPLGATDFPQHVDPYVVAWLAEKNRLEVEAQRMPTLEETREAKIASICAAVEQRIFSGFDHTIRDTTYRFSYDRDDQINFSEANGAAILAVATHDADCSISWRGWIGDTPHIIPLNTQEYLALARAAGDHKTICLAEGWQRQDAARQAQTLKELEEI